MTNRGLVREVVTDLSNPKSLADEVFRHIYTHEADLQTLLAVAAEVFYRKRINMSLLEGEVAQLRELVETIALVIGKTYVARCDSYSLADDEALTLISDLLIEYNPVVIARNESKRIPKNLRR